MVPKIPENESENRHLTGFWSILVDLLGIWADIKNDETCVAEKSYRNSVRFFPGRAFFLNNFSHGFLTIRVSRENKSVQTGKERGGLVT